MFKRYLTLDLPKQPLFKEADEKINIPQVSIYTLLEKYNGKKLNYSNEHNVYYRYTITSLPKNLIILYKRFEKNSFFISIVEIWDWKDLINNSVWTKKSNQITLKKLID